MKPNRKWDPLRPVRVRRDPPTLEEAVVAAQGLSDDIEEQVEIASGLMGVPQEEVRPVIASARPSETARGFERSSRAMPQVVVLRRRAVRRGSPRSRPLELAQREPRPELHLRLSRDRLR